MNKRDNKKEHELWFKNEFPDDYLLFIHDASREALIKYVNSEEVWLASANREGYKLVPLEPTPKMIDSTWDHDYKIYDMSSNDRNEFIYKAMIGAVDDH